MCVVADCVCMYVLCLWMCTWLLLLTNHRCLCTNSGLSRCVQMHVSVCRLCVFSRGKSNSALAAQMCCMVLWNLTPPPSPTIAAPSPPLSSKPAQNSALRHMWKQFSQCPEQGSPHTHKQTYTHTLLIHTHKIHTHFTLSYMRRHTHAQHTLTCYSHLSPVEVLIAWHLTVC